LTSNFSTGRATGRSHLLGKHRTFCLIGAAILLCECNTLTSLAQAQTVLPAVTVESATPARRPTRATTAPRRAQATSPQRSVQPAPPTASERAIAAAAARYQQILGYRAMPDASTLRGATSPLNTSQVVNVVPQQVISDQKPRNLDDALINVSGITQANTFGATNDGVIRRGFGSNRDGSIMRNGMPLMQLRAFTPAVQSVEVLKGPASLLYGIQDPGGIVNTISKRPDLYQHGEISLSGATYGSRGGGDVTLDLTGPIGQDGLAYRFIAYNVNEDYWRNFGTRHETLIAPSLSWYGDDTTVHVNYEHRDYKYPFDRGIAFDPRTLAPLAGVPITRRFDEPFSSTWGQTDLIQISVDHRINENWKLYAGYSFNHESYGIDQVRNTGIDAVTGNVTRRGDTARGPFSHLSYGTAYMQGNVWIGGFKNEVTFGGDAQYRVIYRDDQFVQTVAPINIYNPVYGVAQPASTISNRDSNETDKLGTRALFVKDTLYLTDWLLLVGGMRWMEYDQLAGTGRPFSVNTNIMADKILPQGGVVVKLNDQVSLYASYTQSLKPNSSSSALDGGTIITANIAPEEGISWETGVKFDVNKRLSGTLAFYDIDKKNVLVSQFDPLLGTNVYYTAGKVRSRGVEFDITGRLTDNWTAIATYAYTAARVTDDPVLAGKALQYVAPHTASLFMVYDFGTLLPGRLRVGAGARYVDDRAGDASNTYVLPSYTVADAFATYEVNQMGLPVTYQLNIKNMFDTIYFPSAQNRFNVIPGEARRFSLAATVKF
jgi:iron complex outermembrane receptor protein